MKEKLRNIVSVQASRLKKIRLYLSMTRQEFGDATGISQFTLRSWENGAKKLTANGAERLITALKSRLNFSCTFDWLWNGKGDSPIAMHEKKSFLLDHIGEEFDSMHEKILNEVITFKKLNPHSIVVAVSDNAFHPLAQIGDYIGFQSVERINLDQNIGKLFYIYSEKLSSIFGILNKQVNLYSITPILTTKIIPISSFKNLKLYQLIWFRKLC